MNFIDSAPLINSIACLALTIAVTLALKDRELRQQLRALRLLVSYVTVTLLLNLYFVSTSGTTLQHLSLVLSAATIVLLWVAVYNLWAKGE